MQSTFLRPKNALFTVQLKGQCLFTPGVRVASNSHVVTVMSLFPELNARASPGFVPTGSGSSAAVAVVARRHTTTAANQTPHCRTSIETQRRHRLPHRLTPAVLTRRSSRDRHLRRARPTEQPGNPIPRILTAQTTPRLRSGQSVWHRQGPQMFHIWGSERGQTRSAETPTVSPRRCRQWRCDNSHNRVRSLVAAVVVVVVVVVVLPRHHRR
jgi:hypothetical protein